MTVSSLTLTTLRTRVRTLLYDTGGSRWSDDELAEAIRHALDEYSRAALLPGAHVRPLRAIGSVTPAEDNREVSLSALTGCLSVERVWFPYDAAEPTERPKWIQFDVWDNGGALTLFLDIDDVPDGVDVARVFYVKRHALKDLDSAAATTYEAIDDSLLVEGAAYYATVLRSEALIPSDSGDAKAADRLKMLADEWQSNWRRRLTPRRVVIERPLFVGRVS